ncbi:MAG: peptidase M13 [Actinomycetales bacterium]|nr:peptidase M13 [Actinomycetales bacterium]
MKSGIDLTHVAEDIRPQDDLYRHLSGRWIENAEIPADRAVDGAFYALRDNSEIAIRDIVEAAMASDAPAGSNERKIGDLYRSFMDTARIEELSWSPIADDLRAAAAVSDLPAFIAALGKAERGGVSGLFGAWVTTDKDDPDANIVYLTQGGLGLPDESYYREDTFAEIREKYLAHIARSLALVEHADAEGAAQRILQFETRLAAHHWDQVRNRDAVLTFNKRTWQEFSAMLAGVDVDSWRDSAGIPAHAVASLVVRQPDFFESLPGVLADTDVQALRDWLAWNIVQSASSYLSDAFVQESFDFYGRTLTGAQELKDRWKRGVGLVEGVLGEAAGELYVAKHFPPAAKSRMQELVANLVEAYRQQISTLEWMGEQTRERALEKLAKFTPKIGYPDKWRDYSSLEISADDLMANVRAADAFEQKRQFDKVGKPVDRSEWLMTPQTVNAYYMPGMNEIVFPAAILQPPFFDVDADDAVNYGGIGAVIGHEIGHGFDDQGSRYDGDGRLNNWWTDEDRTEFEKRTAMLIEQYNALEPAEAPGHTVNGAFTLGENIGDLGGLSIAYVAYKLALAGQEPPVIDGLTGDQRFFLGWAQVWRCKIRPEAALQRLTIDPHSPNEFRCNAIVRNVPAFYEAFGVNESDALWLDPAERVRIW